MSKFTVAKVVVHVVLFVSVIASHYFNENLLTNSCEECPPIKYVL